MEVKQRNFVLGDNWFYFKIYTGVKTADTILTQVLVPVCNDLLARKWIENWFFIRYSDPDFHIRVRLKLIDIHKMSEIILILNNKIKPYIENRMISKFQADTYTRELERYGNKTIDEAEWLFFYDSQSTIQMLNLIDGDTGENYRWHFACLAIDYLLNDFGFTEAEKLKLMDNLQQGFGKEFGMNTHIKVQLDEKFRTERPRITNFLHTKDDSYKPFYQILEQKSIKTKNIIEKIIGLKLKKELEVEFESLIGSFIHMMLNRIFKSKQRLNEMVIYSLLYRFYKSEMARNKKAVKT